MAKKTGRRVSVDTMVRFFMKSYDIPTQKDVENILARINRLEQLILRLSRLQAQRLRGTDTGGPGGRAKSVPTATDLVLDVFKRHKNGAGFMEVQDETGFEGKKIRNIIFRLGKLGKIKRVTRGIYTAV